MKKADAAAKKSRGKANGSRSAIVVEMRRSDGVAVGQGVFGLTDPQSIEDFTRKAKLTPEAELRTLLVKTGIYTRSGKLAKRFRTEK